jgi:hypothetical protein
MNRRLMLIAAALLGLSAVAPAVRAETEKEKALAHPYPNDFGPETLDAATLKSYPANVQAGYKALIKGCAQCHSAARPLNSRFVEPSGGIDDKKQEAALAAMKKDQPQLFKDDSVWQVEVKLWNRYVKRMMNKPGCNIAKADGKAIWEFLAYDSVARKTGANAEKWAAHRKKLVEELKAKHPKRYEELKAAKDL